METVHFTDAVVPLERMTTNVRYLSWFRSKVLWVLVVVVVGSVATYIGLGKTSVSDETHGVPHTVAIPVERGSVARTIASTGQLQPYQDVTVAFPNAGRVTEVLVVEGESVDEGEILARIDDTSARLDYLRAASEYEAAKVDSPPSVIEERRLQVELARRGLENAVLKAPFAGIAVDVNISPGDWVGAEAKAVRLVDVSTYKVSLTVDETDLRFVAKDQDVEVRIESMPRIALAGKVTRVGLLPSSTESVVLYPVEVLLELKRGAEPTSPDVRRDNVSRGTGARRVLPQSGQPTEPAGLLRPGLTVYVDIVVDKAEDVLTVPVAAVVASGARQLVTKVNDDGSQEVVAVETGLSDGLNVEIRSGLSEGDRILANNYRLYQTILEESQSGAGQGGRSGFNAPIRIPVGAIRR